MLRLSQEVKQRGNNGRRNSKIAFKQAICKHWSNQNYCAGCNEDVPSSVKKP